MTTNPLNINDDGLQDFDSTTGDFTAIDLTEKGDLLAYTGAVYQRFAKGMDGYVLKADSSQPVGLRWACSGFEFIETQTASNSATIEFTDFQDADCYSGYKIVWKNAFRRSKDFNQCIRYSIDNGATWLTSGYKFMRDSVRGVADDEIFPYSAAATRIETNGSTGETLDMQLNGECYFYPSDDASSTLKNGMVYTSTNYIANPDEAILTSRGCALNTTTSVVNGFQFFFDTGNITSGTFTLYGVLL